MTATTDTPTTTPSAPDVETTLPPAPAQSGPRRRLMVFVAAATLAVGGGTAWIAASAGSGDTPARVVETVDEGQRYGSADAAERQTAPEGQRYGSADAAEHRTVATDGQRYGSADAADHHTLP